VRSACFAAATSVPALSLDCCGDFGDTSSLVLERVEHSGQVKLWRSPDEVGHLFKLGGGESATISRTLRSWSSKLSQGEERHRRARIGPEI
jgi:hypothetical protein